MASLFRRGLVYHLSTPYVHSTLCAIKEHAGFVYRTHRTATDLVARHCAHWEDLLDPKNRRMLDLETERLRRSCAGVEAMVDSYLAACTRDVADVESVDLAVLVVCIWHHVYAAAAAGVPLDSPACDAVVNRALKSLRDIVCSNAAAHSGVDPYGISRFCK